MRMRVQVCWKKFCAYFDVELRAVPVSEQHGLVTNPADIPAHVDENTVGVVCILGSTYNGHMEDVAAVDGIIGALLGCAA
jgi:glutamate decarboxylase